MITVGIGITVFQIFHQNERVFRDQNLVIEMQQTARVVASQIADEVRMAGQGVPVYASTFDNAGSEPVAAILSSSTSSRIDFRAGLSNVETTAASFAPIDFSLGMSRTISVGDGSPFPSGKFVYIWGPTSNSMWGWIRGELTSAISDTLTVTPRQGSADTVRFTQAPAVSLEEAVSFYLSGTAIKRATATDMTNQDSPAWSAANEIGRNFTSLVFTYYDRNNHVVTPNSLANRLAVARVDVQVVAQTAAELSNGTRPAYALALRTTPRNSRMR